MRLFLIGFMGSGKSHTGRQLAEQLAYPFIDLDNAIEKAAGSSISDIFASQGEAYFRQLEKEQLHLTSAMDRVVVATGGGAACFFDNMDWMNAQGCTIYLKAKPELLAQRLQTESAQRPLIANLDQQALFSFIHKKLEGRRTFYEKAQIIYTQSSKEEPIAKELFPLFQ